MRIHEVGNEIQISMDRLVLCKLRFHAIQPVNKCLESLSELT